MELATSYICVDDMQKSLDFYESFLRHQAFLNTLFVNDLTVDIRISLFLEVFESLVNEMASNGEIILKAQPYRILP